MNDRHIASVAQTAALPRAHHVFFCCVHSLFLLLTMSSIVVILLILGISYTHAIVFTQAEKE
jgi:hypothetical protein